MNPSRACSPHNQVLQQTTTSTFELIRVAVLAAGRCSPSVGGQRWPLRLKPRPLYGGKSAFAVSSDFLLRARSSPRLGAVPRRAFRKFEDIPIVTPAAQEFAVPTQELLGELEHCSYHLFVYGSEFMEKTMKKRIVFCVLGLLVVVGQAQAAPRGSFTKNNSTMPFHESVATWNVAQSKLIVSVFPSRLSSEERRKVQSGESISSMMFKKSSPDQNKWQWYPYARFELRFAKIAEPTLKTLKTMYIAAYGIEEKNFTDNLNIRSADARKLVSKLNIDLSNNRYGLVIEGPYEIYRSTIHMDLTVSDIFAVK
jgi:hypothetical protein